MKNRKPIISFRFFRIFALDFLSHMKKEEVSKEHLYKILESIMPLLIQNGLKATTMDSIASSLQMSKRTLYEIFGSKEEMFREAHKYFHKKMTDKMSMIFSSSGNIMEAIIKCFIYNRDLMGRISADFFREMEEFAIKENLISETSRRQHHQNLYEVILKGVDEGYFREDINLLVQCKMLSIQMQALKNTQEIFPEDISILDVYDSIILGFLRGISSPKGLQEIEQFMPIFKN